MIDDSRCQVSPIYNPQEVFLTKEYICIAMEYASSGNLFSYVKQAIRLKEAASRWVLLTYKAVLQERN
jgi:hypothetical protein